MKVCSCYQIVNLTIPKARLAMKVEAVKVENGFLIPFLMIMINLYS